jgi:hypothetical protein
MVMKIKIKYKIILGSFILAGLFLAGSVLAHNPRIVEPGGIVLVQNPEISQAFYGELKGFYQDFKINSDKPFNLYVNILAPDLPMVKTNMSIEVFRLEPSTTSLAVLDGANFQWEQFYEPFGGDNYFKGPEFNQSVPAGKYLIRVFNSNYQGKYSLAIGENESFTPKEIFKTIILLPQLKKDFFDKSPWTAYFNYTGIFLLAFLLILFLAVFFIWYQHKKKKKIAEILKS